MKKHNVYETERLILKPMSTDDAAFILKLYNMPSFIKFIGGRSLRTIKDAENYMSEKFLPRFEKLGYGNYLISLKDSGEKIGGVGIFERPGLDVQDIGFSFLEEYQGKGYGYEAAERILKAGFEDFGLNKISAITTKKSIASQKLIEKLGLKFIKIINLPNDPEDLLYYEIKKRP